MKKGRGLVRLSKTGIPVKKVHDWSKLVKTEFKVLKAKSKTKVDVISLNIEMKITPSAISKIYPDILVQMMPFMDEKSYLNFVAVNSRMEEMSLKNSTFLEFLRNYRPNEYRDVLNSEKMFKNISPKYIYYEIHKELYPDYYYVDEDGTGYETGEEYEDYEFESGYISDDDEY